MWVGGYESFDWLGEEELVFFAGDEDVVCD